MKTILLSEDSADPYNPKVIRSSQGGIFHTNIIEDADLRRKLTEYKNSGYNVYLFTLDAKTTLSEISQSDRSDRSVIVFGSEAHGISNDILEMGFEQVKIEGKSGCESLNAAIACGIALYEFK